MSSGWFRLWLVCSVALVFSVAAASAYYIWAKEACYTVVTVSIADDAQQQDRDLALSVRKEATEKTFCGTTQYSPVLTLDELAKKGAVTQIGLSWLEPSGWSFKDHDELDVIDRNEIKAEEIIGRSQRYVQNARMRYVSRFIIAAVAASLAMLSLGLAVAWVRKGFQRGGA